MSDLSADTTTVAPATGEATRAAPVTGGLPHIYNYYRTVLGVSLLVVFLNDGGRRLLGALDAELFLDVLGGYIAANILIVTLGFLAPGRVLERRGLHFTLAVLDIVALTALMYASGGVGSGLGTMIILSVAAGSILTTGPVTLVLPAVATLGVLYEEALLYFRPHLHPAGADFFQAGLLGVLYFGAAVFVRNLSDRLRATEAQSLERAQEIAQLERLSDTIIQRMRTGILVAGPQGRVRLCNRAAQRLLGLTESLVGGQLPPPVAERLRVWRQRLRQDATPLQLAPTAPEVRVSFSALPEDVDTVVFLEDHSELSQQAQQLKLAALGRLSASISHEIRNPLGAVSHAAQLLNESEALDTGDRRLAQIIDHHTRRMNEIIRNVLELSRGHVPEPVKLPLEDWLLSFVAEYREARGQPVEINVDVEPATIEVCFDPGQLRQVMTNLTDNALRYSARHSGHPVAHLEAAVDPLSERPYLSVRDTGPGVAADRIPSLFEPFFTTEAQGTGLGLYISRELCAANQARLSYAPAPGGGACFRITFPHPDRTA